MEQIKQTLCKNNLGLFAATCSTEKQLINNNIKLTLNIHPNQHLKHTTFETTNTKACSSMKSNNDTLTSYIPKEDLKATCVLVLEMEKYNKSNRQK